MPQPFATGPACRRTPQVAHPLLHHPTTHVAAVSAVVLLLTTVAVLGVATYTAFQFVRPSSAVRLASGTRPSWAHSLTESEATSSSEDGLDPHSSIIRGSSIHIDKAALSRRHQHKQRMVRAAATYKDENIASEGVTDRVTRGVDRAVVRARGRANSGESRTVRAACPSVGRRCTTASEIVGSDTASESQINQAVAAFMFDESSNSRRAAEESRQRPAATAVLWLPDAMPWRYEPTQVTVPLHRSPLVAVPAMIVVVTRDDAALFPALLSTVAKVRHVVVVVNEGGLAPAASARGDPAVNQHWFPHRPLSSAVDNMVRTAGGDQRCGGETTCVWRATRAAPPSIGLHWEFASPSVAGGSSTCDCFTMVRLSSWMGVSLAEAWNAGLVAAGLLSDRSTTITGRTGRPHVHHPAGTHPRPPPWALIINPDVTFEHGAAASTSSMIAAILNAIAMDSEHRGRGVDSSAASDAWPSRPAREMSGSVVRDGEAAPSFSSARTPSACNIGAVNLNHFAAFAVFRCALDRVGGFDEAMYPAYSEDIEYALRLRSGGLRRLFLPKALSALVVHSKGGAGRSDQSRARLRRWARGEYLLRKWGFDRRRHGSAVDKSLSGALFKAPFGVAGLSLDYQAPPSIRHRLCVEHGRPAQELWLNYTSYLQAANTLLPTAGGAVAATDGPWFYEGCDSDGDSLCYVPVAVTAADLAAYHSSGGGVAASVASERAAQDDALRSAQRVACHRVLNW